MQIKTGGKEYEYLRRFIKLPDGSKKVIYAKSEDELEKKVRDALFINGIGGEATYDMCFDELAALWYETCKKPFLRESSLWVIRNALNTHILPIIGPYMVRCITPR